METPVFFKNGEKILRGILHQPAPDTDKRRILLVFLHGWSGCRLGPHRMFVNTARQLTDAGFACLRFDFAGRGDSDGRAQDTTIASMIADTRAALDFVAREHASEKVILLGICSGAKVAIGAASAENRIHGLILWSAEAMGYIRPHDANQRRMLFTLREYAAKLARLETWKKLLRFKVNMTLVGKAITGAEHADAGERQRESGMLDDFKKNYRRETLFIYGGRDAETQIAGKGYETFCRKSGMPCEFHEIPDANHSFYSLEWERQVIRLTMQWLEKQV